MTLALGTRQHPSMYLTNGVGQGNKQAAFADWDMSCWGQQLNPHWGANDDRVSLEVYKPLGTRIKIEFEYNNLNPSERTRWNRIDIIRPRN